MRVWWVVFLFASLTSQVAARSGIRPEKKSDEGIPVTLVTKDDTAASVAHVPALSAEEDEDFVPLPFPHPDEIHRMNALHLSGLPNPNEVPPSRSIIVSPSFGPTSGGVWIQIIGAGSFHTPNSLQCKLDLVEQYCYSNHYMYSWCYVTPKCSGVFPINCHNGPMLFNGTYAVMAKVPWVTSVYPFSGDISGGTPVTVRGWNFEPHCPRQLLCRFGDKVVKAKYYTSSSIMCIAPCATKKGFVSVEVSNDGGKHWSMSGVQFGYVGTSLTDAQMTTCLKYLAPDQSVASDVEIISPLTQERAPFIVHPIPPIVPF